MWKVQLFELNYNDQEENAVADVLRSRWITMGENTKAFENKFGEFLGATQTPTAVSSATAALHMSLLALGIGTGDEVIISALTFIADANVIRMVGAQPVLADITSHLDWNVSAKTIRDRMTPNTKAIILVHYGGVPCEMDEILSICKEKKIALIEDVAHAPGAMYKGIKCGSFGDLSAFSFFTNKNISVGEGGMVVAKTDELNTQIKYLRSHGMSTLTLDRHQGRAITYDVLQPGLNYRMDEMRAALGIVQLNKLESANKKRKELTEYYDLLLADLDVIVPFQNLSGKTSAYHIYPLLVLENINREMLSLSMKDKGIQTSIHYPSIKSFTAYRELKKYETPIADFVSRGELTLPLYPTMTFEQVDIVADNLAKSLNEQK